MKKLIATILTIVMLTGIAGVVPAYAKAWTPAASDDGYTKVLADYDMESPSWFTGTQVLKNPGFDGDSFNTDDWADPGSTYFSVVSAADAKLPDAAVHGNVVKHTGASGEISTTGNNTMANNQSISSSGAATKAVAQVDIYIDEMVNNFIDVFSVDAKKAGATGTHWKLPLIRFYNGGTIKASISDVDGGWEEIANVTFETKKWYTVTVALDISSSNSEERTFSAWLDDTLIVNNRRPHTKLATTTGTNGSDGIKGFNLYMSWDKGTVENAPTVYWDNMKVYFGNLPVIDSPIENDNHGKVLEVTGGTYFAKAFLNPLVIDADYALAAPSKAKIAEYGQVKLEADVYVLEKNTRSKVGVLYVNSTGAEKELDLVALDGYDVGWHTVVVYIDAVNGKYTSYVDDVVVNNNKAISADGFTAPRAMYVAAKTTSAYADNIKFSVPKYYSENGGGIQVSGTQLMTDPEADSDVLTATGNWETVTDDFSVVSATEENLTKPVIHGNVIKHVGPSGELAKTTATEISSKTINGATKVVLQADIYIDKMSNNHIDLFNIPSLKSDGKTASWTGETVRFLKDGTIVTYVANADNSADTAVEIGTFEEDKWYNVTVELDVTAGSKKIAIWLDAEKVYEATTLSKSLNSDACVSLRSFKMAVSCNKGNIADAPVIYWDNIKAYKGYDAAVSGVVAPVFVQTRQGENKYTLAYLLEEEKSPKAVLIAAVYSEDDLLDNVAICETKQDLGDGECQLLLTEFEMGAGKILNKMLWEDFTTLKPLLENQ